MSSTETLTIPLNKLEAWPGNVRRTEPKASLEELKASIQAHGLLQPVLVQQKNGRNLVIAGRRRYLAAKSLQKDGVLKANHPIPCILADPEANPTELSLAENFQREQMHPADEFMAFKKLSDDGLSSAEIAARNGISETQVERRLKLANVSPNLIKLFREGGLSLNHMMAFAVTTDHEAQERVWKNMPTWSRNNPEAIRDQLTEGEIESSDRRVKFVTLAAYEKAGGVVRRDLFSADENAGFILDKEMLADLVNKELERYAQRIRKEGWKWVEFREHYDHSEWSNCGRRYEEATPLPAKQQAALDKLQTELESLMEDENEEENPAIDKLQAKIEKIEGGRERSWQPDTLAIAGAVVSIGNNGKVEITRGLVKPEDKPKKAVAVKSENGTVTDEPEVSGLSASLVESLTTIRSAAVSATLMLKPDVALAATVHAIASQIFLDGRSDTAVQISARKTYLKDIEGTAAHQDLEENEKRWREKLPTGSSELWDWCLKQKSPVLLDLLAFCAAQSVDVVQRKQDRTDNDRLKNGDQLATALNLDLSQWFKATAENYFSRVSKPQIVEALKEAKVEITPAIEKAKKGELAAIAECEIGKVTWLPALLRGPAP